MATASGFTGLDWTGWDAVVSDDGKTDVMVRIVGKHRYRIWPYGWLYVTDTYDGETVTFQLTVVRAKEFAELMIAFLEEKDAA